MRTAPRPLGLAQHLRLSSLLPLAILFPSPGLPPLAITWVQVASLTPLHLRQVVYFPSSNTLQTVGEMREVEA